MAEKHLKILSRVGRQGAFKRGVRGMRQIGERELRDLGRATERGLVEGGAELKETLRGQLRRTGMRKLAGTWQQRSRRAGVRSISRVFSKAPHIVGLAETGGTVRPRRGRFLVIPTKAAGRKPGRRGGRARKELRDFADAKNVRLIFPRGRRGGGLVVRQTRTRSTILFFLVRQARHRKRIDVAGAARKAHDEAPLRIIRNMPR